MGNRVERAMKRRIARASGSEQAVAEQPHRPRKGRGPGMETLHTTKGWRGASFRRIAAGRAIASVFEDAAAKMAKLFQRKRRAVPKDTYRFQKRSAPKGWPSTVTRQQRRREARA